MDKPKLRQKPLPSMTEAEAARFIEAARTDPNGILFTFWLLMGHKAGQDEQKRRAGDYTDMGLVFAKPTGLPMRRDAVSAGSSSRS